MSSKIPIVLNKETKNYESVRKLFEKSFSKSFDDLCKTKDYDDIIDKKTILNNIKKKKFDNIFFIVDAYNNLLAFADIKIDNNIVKIDNLCNNFKLGKGYGKILLTYIFNKFNDDLVNSKKIISLSPITDAIPYYLKFKYPNFPKLPLLDSNYNNFKTQRIIHDSTDNGEILYGNADIIKDFLLNENYIEFLKLLDEYDIYYDKSELDTKDIEWFNGKMYERIKMNKDIDDDDKHILLKYITRLLKYTPVSLPDIDDYIPISQKGGYKKINFVINNNRKKQKKNYNFLSKFKK